MLKKTITYTDYDGNEREEVYYFNLNKAELLDLELNYEGGVSADLESKMNRRDVKGVVGIITDIVKRSYGEKSNDGKHFLKNDDLLNNFVHSEAYSTLLMDLMANEKMLEDFMAGIMPSDVRAEAERELERRRQEKEKAESEKVISASNSTVE